MNNRPGNAHFGGWPVVAYEEREWVPSEAALPLAAMIRARQPYRAAVVPTIARKRIEMTNEVASLCDEALAEIHRFDAEFGADLAPFSAILLRSESAASSQIEQLTATAKAIALAEVGDTSRVNATAIVANVRAMEASLAHDGAPDGDLILAIHRELMAGDHPEWAGRWRTEQVWIGGNNYSPHGAAFVPPHHESVPRLIADLAEFMADPDLPIFAQTMIAHAQFETVHPFPDGNGRTGRALIQSMLRYRRVARRVTVPISAGLLTDTAGYFDSLTAYRSGDPSRLIELAAHATFAATNNGRHLVADLRRARAEWNDRIVGRSDSSAYALADVLLQRPVVSAADVERLCRISAPASYQAITNLETAGILSKVSGGQRNRRWAASEILAALDAFAARAQRRR